MSDDARVSEWDERYSGGQVWSGNPNEALVAPGGDLLFVHHADVDREHALAHGCDPDDYVGPDAVLTLARQREGGRSSPTSAIRAR